MKNCNFIKGGVVFALLMIGISSALNSYAYESSLKEGRIMEVNYHTRDYSYPYTEYEYTHFWKIGADTTFLGQDCKMVFMLDSEINSEPIDTIYCYEDNGAFYSYGCTSKDYFVIIWDMNEPPLDVLNMDIMGTERLIHVHGDKVGNWMFTDYWIDGIGSTDGYFLDGFPHPGSVVTRKRLQKVWDGDKLIFDREKFVEDINRIASITGIERDDDEAPELLYDLHGQKVDNPRKGTIYVTSKHRKVLWR